MTPTISQNPFLKNDKKRLNKMKSFISNFGSSDAREQSNERKENGDKVVDDREHSLQRSHLKQELDLVLKGIMNIGDEAQQEVTHYNDEEEVDIVDIDGQVIDENNKELDTGSCAQISSRTSDITIPCEDAEGNSIDKDGEEVTNKTEDEIIVI